jgi:hypothetical protein
MVKTWEECKKIGSAHYKTGKTEPIDLYRSAIPHPSYNSFDIKALIDTMKYAFRLLTRGYLQTDVDKIKHLISLYEADMAIKLNTEVNNEENSRHGAHSL